MIMYSDEERNGMEADMACATVLSYICLEELRKTIKTLVKIAGAPGDTWTGYLSNTSKQLTT